MIGLRLHTQPSSTQYVQTHYNKNITVKPVPSTDTETAIRVINRSLQLESILYLDRHRHLRDSRGTAMVVRNGIARPRKVTLSNGKTVVVRAPRIHDRRSGHQFRSELLPPFLRNFSKIEITLPFSIYSAHALDNLKSNIEAYLNKIKTQREEKIIAKETKASQLAHVMGSSPVSLSGF